MYSRIRARFVIFALGATLSMLLTWPSTVIADASGVEAALDGVIARAETVISSSIEEAYVQLQRSVNRLYAAAVDEDTELMLRNLAIVDYRFKRLPVADEVSIEGLQEMSVLLKRLGLSLTLPNTDKTRLREEAAALLLAADALAKPQQPLWHEYRSVLAEDAAALARAVNGETELDSGPTPATALRQLRSDYETIRTAVLLSIPEEDLTIVRSDAVLRYAATVLTAVPYNKELAERLVSPLQETLLSLFPIPDKNDESVLVPPAPGASWAWSATMGSFIVTILTWVGWRRYKDDEYESRLPRVKPGDRQDAAERLMERWRNRR